MKYVAIFLVLLCLFTSCEKELDFKYHDVDPQLVIEASISESGAVVALTNTTPMDEAIDGSHITDAVVRISDLTEGTAITLQPDESGLYVDPTPGVVGREYKIEVVRQGKSYSATGLMRGSTEILSLEFQWIKMPYDYVAVLQISFLDAPTKEDYYWIRLYRNGEPYKWLLTDDSAARDGVINEVTMTSRMDLDEEDEEDALRDGDIVDVTVTPISQAMFDYLTALQSNSNGPRMFSGDFCLGYFLPASSSRSSIIFRPSSLPFFHSAQ